MISTLLSIEIDSSVQAAVMFMTANNIGSLLVKKFDEYVGIVTEKELARKVLGKGLHRRSLGIEEVITRSFFSMDRYLPVEEANRFMHKNKIRHLMVTQEDKILSILSMKDSVVYFSKDFGMQE
ncbi:CBS domain-containing protein [Nitrospinae bacterium]|jgi:signal-transduction protein with cAMP-binding, CBS, and nucleotidyltransferase domain|nr:CBS domain-containing protein [Nitrospinota bacterium]